ncbi:Alpha/Beta hydrolase protein [Xylaria sp. CBS 124048]|nr:Alpha/Beta hydrolase protein [Xylaria sp. CBS 124048]
MSSAQLPTVVLTPGAFITPKAFEKVVEHLDGIPTHPGGYPSCNAADPSTASLMNDIAAYRSTILSLLDQGKNVVILAHSYGGAVAGAAVKDLDKVTRRVQGHASAVVGLLYVTGNISLEGETLFEARGDEDGAGLLEWNTPSEGLVTVPAIMDTLYHDCDPARESELAKYMNPHAMQAFVTKPSTPAWRDEGFENRRVYIRTLHDKIQSKALQTKWIEKTGVKWEVLDFESGHMPFLSRPEALAEMVVKAVRKFAEP